MSLTKDDWQTLDRLRRCFLEGSGGDTDYWQSERDLACYDQTFAQRIGWKWDYVLAELKARHWEPSPGDLLDWGCGSGIAHRAFLDHYGTKGISTLRLWDRSNLAVQFASRRSQDRFPDLNVRVDDLSEPRPATLLLSHVLTELDGPQLEEVLGLAAQVTSVVWVEPGTHSASRSLIDIRERLRDQFQVVAPCVHQGPCGMVAPEHAAHWCHHFATPPPAVFTDGDWARFAGLAGIDLRSLPLSFLVLDKRFALDWPPGTVRLIGRPRLYKAHALLLGSSADGLHERRLSKRNLPEGFRQLKKGQFEPVQTWECDGKEITSLRPVEPSK